MNHSFYQLPIRLGLLMAGRELPTCGAGTSIAQVLYLLLYTQYGELRSDRTFGCKIWDLVFDRNISYSEWTSELCDSFEAAIRRHEPRLRAPHVSVQFLAVEHQIKPLPDDFQQAVVVTVDAMLNATQEPFHFTTKLYLGQLSMR
ncbi:GPW/gp25 family protein [Spirosoma taeanense]|uniref:GPW/gp25 family protein n=1 Tax=Spirosoma taeanense TaxID=2735870 RepID=A0A6M5YDF2_9BACT|nr:GPW/gp25 family protein [Spirosoma taeanense]QJW91634.1 GPW/gp25 family protein [Spirosoma taeanense]